MQVLNPVKINDIINYSLSKKIIYPVKDSKYVKIWSLGEYHYSGDLDENNNFDGYGEIIYYNHPEIKSYKGQFIAGCKQGLGYQVYKNDEIYHGFFLDDKQNGSGKLYSANGIIKYQGDWINDKITGKIIGYDYDQYGKQIYFGQIEDGVYNGIGIVFKNDFIIQYGLYQGGKPISKINFYEQTPIVAKVYNVDINVKDIGDFHKEISMTKSLAVLEKYKYLFVDVLKPVITSPDRYKGTILEKDNEYIYQGNGVYVSKVNRYEGIFENGLFISGNVYLTRIHELICSGTFANLDIQKNVDSIDSKDDIIKHLIEGSLYSNITSFGLNNKNKQNYKFPSNNFVFTGTFVNGRLEKGIIYNINKNDKIKYYEGTFNTSTDCPIGSFLKLHGHGIEYFPGNKKKYEGEFKNGVYHGNGTLYHNDTGSIEYIGEFVAGEKHGNGMLFDVNQHLIWDGIFTYDNIGTH